MAGPFLAYQKICESGLWIVNELYKEPLSVDDLEQLSSAIGPAHPGAC
jgi:hypothetical protein